MEYFNELVKNPLYTFITVLLGIVVSHLMTYLSKFFKTKFIIWYNKLISKSITNQGLIGEYKNIEFAFKNICLEINRSKKIYIYTGLGTKIRDIFHEIRANIDVTVFLPDTSPNSGINWLEKRALEIKKSSNLGYYNDLRDAINEIDLIRSTLSTFEKENKGSTHIKRYNAPHTCRIILTNNVAFFSPYVKDKYIDSTPISCYLKGSYMYEHLEKTLTNLEEQSVDETKVVAESVCK